MFNPHLTDTEILQKIYADEPAGIENLYNKYAPHVFGIINLLSTNSTFNEGMLVKLFTNLKEDVKLALQGIHLQTWLYCYTFKFTLGELYAKGIEPNITSINNSPAILQRIYNKFLADNPDAGRP